VTTTKPRAAQTAYKNKLEDARKRVDTQRARERAARPTNEPTPSRRSPLRTTPRAERPSAPPPGKVLLSHDDLRALGISYSRQHLHRLIREGRFPAPVALGPEQYARKAWKSEDVACWLAALSYTTDDNEESAA
jgi:prophage regulatory protein